MNNRKRNAKRNRLTWLFAVLVVAAVLGAEEKPWVAPARATARKNPIAANETSIALGAKVYERHCIQCHGPKGKGDGRAARKLVKRPGDLSDPKLWAQSDGALLWKLVEGHKPMPTFETVTSDEERWPVINYIRTLAPKPTPATESKDTTTQ